MEKLSKSYYFNSCKLIRDLVHGYVHLTAFELKIIDSVPFQRLKDIRQLTCQEVYPSARHTRFEHSLGVLQLTKNVISAINENGQIDTNENNMISDQLIFNTRLAALLHDVGHCPFSHLGEGEFDKDEVKEYFLECLSAEEFNISSNFVHEIKHREMKDIGAVHEVLSCIVILKNYQDILLNINVTAKDDNDECDFSVDFEMVIRCILGIEYDIPDSESLKENALKNLCIHLINSKEFDMDKLDYIMRDSFFTGIGAPQIDTDRLFKNIFLNKTYNIVFTSKAVPSLQNMIDARDELYMYVYNHHAVVLSDFFYTYIIRKLSHNAENFINLICPKTCDEQIKSNALEELLISQKGLIPRSYLFSIGSVLSENRTDSDWISLINIIYLNAIKTQKGIFPELDIDSDIQDEIESINCLFPKSIKKRQISKEKKDELLQKMNSAFDLIIKYKNRDFLKPWWKTVYEFTYFLSYHFRDDIITNNLCKWICSGGEHGLEASEFRSEIAKQMISVSNEIYNYAPKKILQQPFVDGDFFIVKRSNRFFSKSTIQKLTVALKNNDILDLKEKSEEYLNNYFLKSLTQIIPQKDYSSIYAEEGFYVFSKKLLEIDCTPDEKKKHYEYIEKIFVSIVNKFVTDGEQTFVKNFQNDPGNKNTRKKFTKTIVRNLGIKENYR